MKLPLKKWRLFWLNIIKEYFSQHYTYHASALTFSSLLSIVPIITVCIAILSALPLYNTVIYQVENFIIAHFITTSGNDIQSYLRGIVNNALHLSGISILFLAVVAIQMINTLEHALNTIWRIKNTRNFLSALILYCTILMSAPLLMGTGFIINSLLVASKLFDNHFISSTLIKFALSLTPILLSTVAFSLIYLFIPNHHVPLKNSLLGGILAAVLFELAKSGFGIYITHFSDYHIVYGSLAAIPIFLLWLYLSWCIVLLGALVSKALTVRHAE